MIALSLRFTIAIITFDVDAFRQQAAQAIIFVSTVQVVYGIFNITRYIAMFGECASGRILKIGQYLANL